MLVGVPLKYECWNTKKFGGAFCSINFRIDSLKSQNFLEGIYKLDSETSCRQASYLIEVFKISLSQKGYETFSIF